MKLSKVIYKRKENNIWSIILFDENGEIIKYMECELISELLKELNAELTEGLSSQTWDFKAEPETETYIFLARE